jgi:hypothetical protein
VRGSAAAADDWMECRSNESNKSDFEYKYEEDPDQMTVKKYKKPKGTGTDFGLPSNVNLTIKDPFVYQEDIVYPQLNEFRGTDFINKTIYDTLLPLN